MKHRRTVFKPGRGWVPAFAFAVAFNMVVLAVWPGCFHLLSLLSCLLSLWVVHWHMSDSSWSIHSMHLQSVRYRGNNDRRKWGNGFPLTPRHVNFLIGSLLVWNGSGGIPVLGIGWIRAPFGGSGTVPSVIRTRTSWEMDSQLSFF